MANALLEAATIVEAKSAEKAALALAVKGYDPLTGGITWWNNKITPGIIILVGYVFGKYDEATGLFNLAGFKVGETVCVWGSAAISVMPVVGGSRMEAIRSYALNVPTPTTLDVLVFIAAPGTLGAYAVDWGSGARIIGLKLTDFQALGFVATKVFIAQITVSPA